MSQSVTALAARFAPLHRELADACGGKPPALPKSNRRKLQAEFVARLARHMGLSLPPYVKGSDLAPTFSADLVRRQVDDRECEGWDHLMREIESRSLGEVGWLAEHLRQQEMERSPYEPFHPAESTLLNPSQPILERLEVDPDDLLERLGDCEMDLLGTYSPTNGITLYYARIGLTAEALGVDAFALGLVVYIHELAHLISHKGLDLDGCDWPTYSFNDASTYSKESIAQWYTSLVVTGRDEEIAFNTLLSRQSEPYTAFRIWQYEPRIREYVRMAMVEIRRCSLPDNQPRGSLFDRVRDYVKFFRS